jgi:hypothetical protein
MSDYYIIITILSTDTGSAVSIKRVTWTEIRQLSLTMLRDVFNENDFFE